MVYKITAKFFFDNGDVRKVDWLEDKLFHKDSTVPLTKEEVETEFRKMFLNYTKDGKVMTIPNIRGEISVIPFSKVCYSTFKVEEYVSAGEENREKV